MPELIDRAATLEKMCKMCYFHTEQNFVCRKCNVYELIADMPKIEAEPVRHGYWIDCDYSTLENGEIESAYKAGLCCSECRTGFKKSRMTFKKYCAACGAIMDAEHPKRGA